MAEKRAHHPMHIKRRTQGSSNEISFSVLDAAREAREAEERDRRDSIAGAPSLFSLGKGKKPRPTPVKGQSIVLSGDVAPASPSSSASDHRMRGIIPVIVVICALLALVLVGGQALMTVRGQQQSLLGTLNDQVATVTACDETLIPFDELVMGQCDEKRLSPAATGDKAPSAERLAEDYRAVVADIAPVRTQLEESLKAMETLQQSLSDNGDKEAASQVVTAARARLNMLDAGVGVIEESLMATEAFLSARAGWNAVIDADAAARTATSLMEDMTEDTVRSSRTKSEEAIEKLETAQQSFTQAESSYPGLDLSSFSDYVDKRLAAQRAAVLADDAYLNRDKEELAAQNERYNALEEEAAKLAQGLGEDDPEQIVANRYYGNIENDADAYEAERLKAGNADAFLREYLGTAA